MTLEKKRTLFGADHFSGAATEKKGKKGATEELSPQNLPPTSLSFDHCDMSKCRKTHLYIPFIQNVCVLYLWNAFLIVSIHHRIDCLGPLTYTNTGLSTEWMVDLWGHLLVDVGRGPRTYFSAVKLRFQPLNRNKQKWEKCFPTTTMLWGRLSNQVDSLSPTAQREPRKLPQTAPKSPIWAETKSIAFSCWGMKHPV